MTLMQPIAPPIAMLHSVKDEKDERMADWCVSRRAFIRLLDTIESAGFTTTHFAQPEAAKPLRGLAQKLVLSFDDCAKHLLDFAVPELVRRGMTAAFYMPTAYIGGINAWDVEKGAAPMELMNEAELRELVRLGMEVGSHGHRHVELRTLPAADVSEELNRSKKILENITGRPVVSFAYPYGSVPAGYQSLLSAAGYRYGLSIYQPTETALALRRFGVYEKDTETSLRRKFSQRYRWMRRLFDAVKN